MLSYKSGLITVG